MAGKRTCKSAGSGRQLGPESRDRHLTKREIQVLTLIAAEHDNVNIATMLGVSVRTIEAHVASMLRKAGARHRAGLIVRSYAAGVLRPGTLPPEWSGISCLHLPDEGLGKPNWSKDNVVLRPICLGGQEGA